MTLITAQIEQLIQEPLSKLGLEIVRIQISGNRRICLQVMIERIDLEALSIDLCTQASRVISNILDEADPIENAYNLEVTSPGLDRPLIKPADYHRFTGERVKIQVHELIANRRNFIGLLQNAHDTSCQVNIAETGEDTQLVSIDYKNIAQAKLEPETNFTTLIKRKNKASKND